jgi:hypothetical protein
MQFVQLLQALRFFIINLEDAVAALIAKQEE